MPSGIVLSLMKAAVLLKKMQEARGDNLLPESFKLANLLLLRSSRYQLKANINGIEISLEKKLSRFRSVFNSFLKEDGIFAVKCSSS